METYVKYTLWIQIVALGKYLQSNDLLEWQVAVLP